MGWSQDESDGWKPVPLSSLTKIIPKHPLILFHKLKQNKAWNPTIQKKKKKKRNGKKEEQGRCGHLTNELGCRWI